MCKDLWSAFVTSGARQLRLIRGPLEHGCWYVAIEPDSMSLETLIMDCSWAGHWAYADDAPRDDGTGPPLSKRGGPLPDIVRSVLGGCSSTLRSLVVSTYLDTLKGIQLPRLTEIRLNTSLVSPEVFAELSRSPVKCLDLASASVNDLPAYDIWRLERVELPEICTDDIITETVAFLKQQTGIESLTVSDYVKSETTSALPDGQIVPLLSTVSFRH